MNGLFPKTISGADKQALAECANTCRGGILAMTTLAASGHPGGSMSSIEMLLAIYKYANISPANFRDDDRDKVIVSIGHISPGVYTALAANGFFSMDDAISQFRLAGSVYEGHIERTVHGVEWTTGNLGQGLSAACGFAMASKIKGQKNHIYCLMGDGEQQKGQISEARRFAAKYKLSNLIAFIDKNCLQISGDTCLIMPQDLAAEYAADGWEVYTIDGHNFDEIVSAVNKAQNCGKPAVIIANTVMGKGVSFMEHKSKYHGSALSPDDYVKAMKELGIAPALDKYKALRAKFVPDMAAHSLSTYVPNVADTKSRFYAADASTDCRSASGSAMTDLVASSMEAGRTPMVVFDCDLAGSIKTQDIESKYPERFIQCGISEHSSASTAGAMSSQGIIPFFTGFTMFAVDEVYNQLRMNDINGSNLKVISTHAGIDVGEDGRTHQSVDYLGLMRNPFGFKVISPADPNQTDHVLRYIVKEYGNIHVVMGRSKVPVITDESGKPFFGEGYKFEFGKIDLLRKGKYPLLSYGVMLYRALKVREIAGGEALSLYNVSSPAFMKDEDVRELAKQGTIFVYEDHISASGLYSTVCQKIAALGLACKVVPFGVEKYAYSGSPDAIYKLIGLDPESVAAKIKKYI